MAVRFNYIDVKFRLKDVLKKKQWLENIAKLHGRQLDSLLINWCSDSYMLEANKKYLSHDYFTDILTFDYSDDTPGLISGELLISIDTVKTNAELYHQKFHVEQLRVMSHGLLHLLGFNDLTNDEVSIMRKMEDISINLYVL